MEGRTKRAIRDYGISIGELPPGKYNKITDVPGVLVGHSTLRRGRTNTGVTVVLPGEGNPYQRSFPAACFVQNGFGKTLGLLQIEELGLLQTPIALTNTLNVGLVHDALVGYMVGMCEKDGVKLESINPVVGECNDAEINEIACRAVKEEHFLAAVENACVDFEMGDIGAGTGTICHGLKGGIGSASRMLSVDGKEYALGVLVQSNYGRLLDLTIDGKPIGKAIAEQIEACPEEQVDKGSIMMLLATNLPLSDRQLKRVIKRMGVGIMRLGSFIGHGSGDIMIGFSTANRIPLYSASSVLSVEQLREDCLDLPFRAAAECCEEAVLNSMIAAEKGVRLDGRAVYSLRDFSAYFKK